METKFNVIFKSIDVTVLNLDPLIMISKISKMRPKSIATNMGRIT